MDELHVWIGGDAVGRLRYDGRLRFAYDDEWLARSDATPLSVSMPLRSGWFEHHTVSPYLWGLLPDNEIVLERWAKQFHCSASNVFALLGNVGGDVAGAAQYLLPGVDPEEGDADTHEPLDDADVARLLREVQKDSAAWHTPGHVGRWSLAGAQSKIALAYDPEHGWSIPHGQAPTTHILKPTVAGLVDHDLNELLCVRAAQRVGLRTETATLRHFEDQRALIVTRHDRKTVDDRIVRIHQEDFCQALRVHPSLKYQSDGGPSVDQMIGVLRNNCSNLKVDVERLCDAVAYNWIILGPDAHAKNYSLLLAGQQVRLAPLYDLGSVAPYDEYQPKVAMAQKVGGEYKAGKITAAKWSTLARSARTDPGDFIGRIHSMIDMMPNAFADATVGIDLTADELEAAYRITGAVVSWASSCRQRLAPPSPEQGPSS